MAVISLDIRALIKMFKVDQNLKKKFVEKIKSFQHKCLRTLLKTRFSTLHCICYTYFQQFRVTDEEVDVRLIGHSWHTHRTAGSPDWVPFVTCFDDALGLSPQPEPNHPSNSTQTRLKLP